jgi:hypothetical protein
MKNNIRFIVGIIAYASLLALMCALLASCSIRTSGIGCKQTQNVVGYK